MDMKPKHQAGYTAQHADLCERTLVTLLRGIGPWKSGVYIIGGLVPRYLIGYQVDAAPGRPPHAGTTDVDLVLDLQVLAAVEAYQRLETNLKSLGFQRATNDEGQAQHFRWRALVDDVAVVVDLLCDADISEGGKIAVLPGQKGVSALKIPGAHLATNDYVECQITAELLNGRGTVRETIRVANIVPFITLKALAYDDRVEEKDAYDLVYCLMYYGTGPNDVAAQFADHLTHSPDRELMQKAVGILQARFASDERTTGARKDGPVSYARFLTNPGRPDLDARHREDAASVVETFLRALGF